VDVRALLRRDRGRGGRAEDAGGAVQYWFLLKARTSFSLQTEQTVTLTDSSDNTQIKTIQYILYLNGRRTGLAELI
jgi:hypothetical protein